MKEITLTDLKNIFSHIISRLELEKVESITIDQDLYHLIPTSIWNDLSNKKVQINSLLEDVDKLIELARQEERACNFVDFDRLASLLRYISEKLNPPTA